MGEGIGTPTASPVLLTLEDAKAYIGAPDLDDDDVLAVVVEAATHAVMNHPGMPRITLGRVTETRSQYVNRERTLFVDECVAVTAVTDADGESIEFTEGPRTGEFVSWIAIPRMSGVVNVTGTWGYEVAPPTLVQAARVTAKAWYERDRAAFLVGLDLNTGFVERPQALPRQVLGLLDEFKRSRVRLL